MQQGSSAGDPPGAGEEKKEENIPTEGVLTTLQAEGSEQRLSQGYRVLECPQNLVGKVIGKGGETIKGVMISSGAASITIDQDFPEGEPRKVYVHGSPQAVEIAVNMVSDLMHGDHAALAASAAAAAPPGGIVDCPREMVGRVIGRAGETIKALQNLSGARIQIDQSQTPCKVNITGPQQAVDSARAMILDIISGGSAQFYQRSSRSSIGVPGPGGSASGPVMVVPTVPPPQPTFAYPSYPAGTEGWTTGQAGTPQPVMQQGHMLYSSAGQMYYYPGYSPGSSGAPRSSGGATTSSAAPGTLMSPWQLAEDGQGRQYWYNRTTGAVQWEPPTE